MTAVGRPKGCTRFLLEVERWWPESEVSLNAMDLNKLIDELYAEKEKIEGAIASLVDLQRESTGVSGLPDGGRAEAGNRWDWRSDKRSRNG